MTRRFNSPDKPSAPQVAADLIGLWQAAIDGVIPKWEDLAERCFESDLPAPWPEEAAEVARLKAITAALRRGKRVEVENGRAGVVARLGGLPGGRGIEVTGRSRRAGAGAALNAIRRRGG